MPMRLNAAGAPLSYFGGDGPGEYPIMLGRDIFNSVSDTGLNRSPVDDLVSYALGGLRVTGEPVIPVEDMAYALVVDGSAVLVGKANTTDVIYLMPRVFCPDEGTIYQYHPDKTGRVELIAPNGNMDAVFSDPLMSIWKLGPEGWAETVYERKNGEITATAGATKQANELTPIPNGRGILYWAQNVWHRMEELREQWRGVLMGAGKTILSGPGVGDEGTTTQALNSAKRALVFPGQVQVDRVVSTAEADMLAGEYATLREDWFAALNAMEQDSPNRPVAEDRVLRMKATTQFVRRLREKLEAIYTPQGVKLAFDRLIVQTAEERLKEAELIQLVQPSDMRARLEALIP